MHGGDLGLEPQRVAGLADALEADLVDAGEEADPAVEWAGGRARRGIRRAAFGRRAGGRQRGRLGERFDDEHAGHHGIAGEVPGEPEVVGEQGAGGYAAHPRLELHGLVDEQKWRAVWQEGHHLIAIQPHDGFSSLARRR